jgi:four helix bundle protein
VGGRFAELTVYREAARLADDVRENALGWESFDRWSLGIQLVRAADSIGANIAEAFGRWHQADQRRLLFMARGSSFETEHWIRRAASRGLMSPSPHAARIDEINRMLNGLISRREP